MRRSIWFLLVFPVPLVLSSCLLGVHFPGENDTTTEFNGPPSYFGGFLALPDTALKPSDLINRDSLIDFCQKNLSKCPILSSELIVSSGTGEVSLSASATSFRKVSDEGVVTPERTVLFTLLVEQGIQEGNYTIGETLEGPLAPFFAAASYVEQQENGEANVFNADPGSGLIGIMKKTRIEVSLCNFVGAEFTGHLDFVGKNLQGDTRALTLDFNFFHPDIPQECISLLFRDT